TESYMEFRLTPLTDAGQRLLQHRERLLPARSVRRYLDARGNTVSYFNVAAPQERITVSFDSVVETVAASPGAPKEALASPSAAGMLLYDYLQPTTLTPWSEDFKGFARQFDGLERHPARQAAGEI